MVSAVTRTAILPYYTLHVPITQQYFANGILHHNSTKTTIIVRQLIGRCINFAGAREVSLRLHMVDAINSLWLDTIPKVIQMFFPGLAESKSIRQVNARGEMRLEFWNKSEYWIGGLDDKERVDKILGREFDGIHHNEVSQISYQSVLKTRTRLSKQTFDPSMATPDNPRGQLKQREFDDLNPVGKSHWSYVEYDLGVNPFEREKALDRFTCQIHNDIRSVVPGNCPLCGRLMGNLYASLRMNPRDNPHLGVDYMKSLEAMPLAMRLRFLEGLDQDELAGALWNLEAIQNARGNVIDPMQGWPVAMRRIVIGVDPSGTGEGEDVNNHDNIGIVVCARGVDDRGYVLEDATLNGPPPMWAAKIEEMRKKWGADLVVAEGNYGGGMVTEVIRHAHPNTPVELVNASRGKAVRAEPVAMLYTMNQSPDHGYGTKMIHCGIFNKLEEEMCAVKQGDTTPEIKRRLGRSPGSLDAMVWSFTKLFDLSAGESLMKFYEKQAKQDGVFIIPVGEHTPPAPYVVPFVEPLVVPVKIDPIDSNDSILRL